MRRRLLHLSILAVLAAWVSGCASGDEPLDVVDPGAVSLDPTYDQVFALIQNRCVLCHQGDDDGDDYVVARGAPQAAEDAPGLEDCSSIVALRFEILARVEDNTMPPGALPRLSSAEKLLIRRWVENGAPAPCN